MSYTSPRTTAAHLSTALIMLNSLLRQQIADGALPADYRLEVRAIGGYAIMSHGLRPADAEAGVDGLTCDIDTLTADYPPVVRERIAAVAAHLGLAWDWLNNDVLGEYGDHSADEQEQASAESAEHLAAMVGAQWQDMPGSTLNQELDVIDLQVADIPTLTRLKLAAVEDLALTGRNQDLPDVLNLLRAQDITDAQALQRAYGDYLRDYPQAAYITEAALGGQRPEQITAQIAEEMENLDDIVDAIVGEDLDQWHQDQSW